MSSVEELCDHITLVNNGKAILSGPVPEVRQQFSQHLIELEFSGSLDALEGRLSDHYKIETRQSLQERNKLLIRMPQDAAPNALLFFFSSRRRHTSWTGDWSSDVCSSDLKTPWNRSTRPSNSTCLPTRSWGRSR